MLDLGSKLTSIRVVDPAMRSNRSIGKRNWRKECSDTARTVNGYSGIHLNLISRVDSGLSRIPFTIWLQIQLDVRSRAQSMNSLLGFWLYINLLTDWID